MRRKVGLLIVVVVAVAALAGYMLKRSPAPVSGGQAPKPAVDTDAQARAVIARLKAQAELTASAAPLAPAAPAPAPGSESNGQEELHAIDTYATTERQKIEAWYSDQVAGLKTQLEQRVQTLSDTDRLAWIQSYQRAKETWSTTSGRSGTTTTGDPAGEYAAILARIKDPRQMTQQDFVNAQIGLAQMRQDKLAAVQREVDRRKAMMVPQKPRTQTQTALKQAGDPTPKVEAITGGAGGQFRALIGDTLVSEGTVVQGYRVKTVRSDSVEFEKDGQTWVQKVN
jgi:hypothetical protein